MSSAIIFKQSFKKRTDPGAAGLNVRHLNYIATRPGTVYNRGCGFGLWGRMPEELSERVQTDLEKAKRIVRAASEKHELYRAIVSVGREDAGKYGLYDRAAWERLVRDHIRDIAKQMDIRPEHMCWCASFHCAKGHPHVHLLYWDNSDQPRQAFIPKPVWDKKAERIRAAFSGDIHRDEIRQAQRTQREQNNALRQAVQALCREANPGKVMDLARLSKSAALEELSHDLEKLLRQLPISGSLRYAYLPPAYKQLVDELVSKALELPELKDELTRYESAVRQVSQLYGNGAEAVEAELEKAREKLRRELGNQVMKAVREMGDELRLAGMEGRSPAQSVIRRAMEEVVPALASYRVLVDMMPRERIPMGVLYDQIPGFREQRNRVVEDVLQDARIRLALQGCALRQAGIDPEALPEDASGRQLFGKELTQEQWQAYLEGYREQRQKLRDEITAQACQDAGWTEEAMRTGAAGLVMGMMRFISQMVSQQQAAVGRGGRDRLRSRDRSKEQRKNEQAEKQFSGSWKPG